MLARLELRRYLESKICNSGIADVEGNFMIGLKVFTPPGLDKFKMTSRSHYSRD